ncbi:Uncharacterised protein family (UPF0233) [Brevibacterium sandarakinum]|uniref:Cell division protein CrgA n=1 Tax=Brevibacterium sandarakinum TaxID=629680 RepID=A0A1H1RPJ7_BRESA|nr:cell division protein CrgA [Brevibacterium sandarakinum]SDS37573.1 Uncharacterised protein family (UPF0233) [Brevibacterium sandarakinum]
MAKSNGRTQRPQRTSRKSSKADVETKAQPNDDVETVEDPQSEQPDAVKDESLEGDLLDLDDGDDKSDVVADDSAADSDGDAAEAQTADDADSDDKSDEAADESEKAEKAEKAAQSEKTAAANKDSKNKASKDEDDKDSKSSKKSETAKGGSAKSSSAKGSAAKGSSAKRTSRSGNPAKRPQGRKTATYTSQSGQQTIKPNPSWFLPVLIGLLLIGLIWLVTFYVSQGAFPVEAWGNWNILIGFGFFVAGLIMSTRWR